MTQLSTIRGRWALVLGASSGFGEAISIRLAEAGVNIVGVHLDRKGTMPHVEEVISKVRATGSQAVYFNANASDAEKRIEIVGEIEKLTGGKGVHGLIHSLAFGTLKPFLAKEPKDHISQDQMNMTSDVMAHSLVYWTQSLFERNLLPRGGRIFAMTSSGGARVWPSYGAVSAAKAALESHCRQLALELASHGVTANAIRAGVTDTPALRKIPGNEEMIEIATKRNPSGRLTTPDDIALMITLLMQNGSTWLTGNVIGVDGGEDIVG